MSAFDDARVLVFVADYIGVDAGAKVNAIGVAFNVTTLQQNGFTAPQHVIALIDVPRQYVGHDFPVSIELRRDDLNQTVTLPGPSGRPEALRISQNVRPDMPIVQAGVLRPEGLYSRLQFALAFPTGLQLQAGVSYRWRVEVEGRHKPDWEAPFHVLALAPGPVFGGPSNPPDPSLPTF